MTSQRPNPGSGERVQLRNERAAIQSLEHRVLDAVAEAGYTEAARFAVRLALEEAVVNAFRHGHKSLPPDATIDVSWKVEGGRTTIAVRDQGPGFDPGGVPDPTLDENLECPTGRGLMLMRAYMTEVRHNERGNEVTMVFDRGAEEAKKESGE